MMHRSYGHFKQTSATITHLWMSSIIILLQSKG